MTYVIPSRVDVCDRACVEECPVRFFAEPLPGGHELLGSPGGAAKLGALGVDTPLVAGLPPQR